MTNQGKTPDPGSYEVPPELWEELKSGKILYGRTVPLDPRTSAVCINGMWWNKMPDGSWLPGESPLEDMSPHQQTYLEQAAEFRANWDIFFDLLCNQLRIPALLDWLGRLANWIGIK